MPPPVRPGRRRGTEAMARRQVARFLVVGVLTVLIDFMAYRALLFLLDVDIAKTLGFLTGTVFAYFANRSYTFEARGGVWVMVRFALVYATTLGCNVVANGLVLDALPAGELSIWAAFVLATGLSATLNFLGMKFFVFSDTKNAGQPS